MFNYKTNYFLGTASAFFPPSSSKAMFLLKKKRYQEQLLDKTENQISNLERMVCGDWQHLQVVISLIIGFKTCGILKFINFV